MTARIAVNSRKWRPGLRWVPLTDPILKVPISAYEQVIPMPTIVLKAADDLAPSELTATATLHFQSCNDSVCHPPSTKVIKMPLKVVSSGVEREKVAGSDFW